MCLLVKRNSSENKTGAAILDLATMHCIALAGRTFGCTIGKFSNTLMPIDCNGCQALPGAFLVQRLSHVTSTLLMQDSLSPRQWIKSYLARKTSAEPTGVICWRIVVCLWANCAHCIARRSSGVFGVMNGMPLFPGCGSDLWGSV
jgi:hypothetical protein